MATVFKKLLAEINRLLALPLFAEGPVPLFKNKKEKQDGDF
jgi:hypothetical protein